MPDKEKVCGTWEFAEMGEGSQPLENAQCVSIK